MLVPSCISVYYGVDGKEKKVVGFFFFSPLRLPPPSKRLYHVCVPRIDAVLPRRATACTSNRGGEAHAALLDPRRGRTASMRAASNGEGGSVRAVRRWGRGDVDGRWVTALLFLYRYWCLSPPMRSAVDGPGGRPSAAPLPAQLRAFYGHSGVALHWHDHLRPAEPASGAWAQTVHTKGAGMDGACLCTDIHTCVGMHIPTSRMIRCIVKGVFSPQAANRSRCSDMI